jgi:hypothetical protein
VIPHVCFVMELHKSIVLFALTLTSSCTWENATIAVPQASLTLSRILKCTKGSSTQFILALAPAHLDIIQTTKLTNALDAIAIVKPAITTILQVA